MLILAIDSSQDIGTIALGRDTELITEYHFYHKMNLLQRMHPTIEQVVSDAGCTVQDIEAIVVSTGPGSFTGLRIGVTVAKTLAYTLGKPVVGIPTLDAIARGVSPTLATFICPMMHARVDEVYWSLFDSTADLNMSGYEASPIEDVFKEIEDRGAPTCFCGSGATRHAEEIRRRFDGKAFVAKPWQGFARGAALIELGHERLRKGDFDDPVTLTPLYVKKPTPVVKLETGEFQPPGC